MPAQAPQTITKKELVNRIAEGTRQTKVVVKEIIQQFLDEIVAELSAGNRLEFREFGVFEVKERAARTAQNPRTLEKVRVPAKRVVKFKVGRLMREHVGVEDEDEEPASPPSSSGRSSSPVVATAPPPRPSPPKPPPSNSPF
jgi:integration host factor subunit beta